MIFTRLVVAGDNSERFVIITNLRVLKRHLKDRLIIERRCCVQCWTVMKHLSFATSSATPQESLKAEKTLFYQTRELNLKSLDSFLTPELGEICNCSFSCLGSN